MCGFLPLRGRCNERMRFCEITVVSGGTGEACLLGTWGQSCKNLSVENPRLCESSGPDIECEMLPWGTLKP